MSESVKAYYDRIGQEYDDDRFGSSSYGQYIHTQECAFLDRWLPEYPMVKTLDMGCGTGRFMKRATDGVDFSEGMLAEARKKFPDKQFHVAGISETGLPDTSFKKVFSMHVLMHLDTETTIGFLHEAHRLLETEGILVVDFPSQKRRSFGQRKVSTDHWHGSNAHTVDSVLQAGNGKWRLVKSRGILFLPIHRFPKKLRPYLRWLDDLMCRSFLKNYASYLIIVLEKQ